MVEGPQAVSSALAAGVVVHDLFMDDHAGVVLPGIVTAAAVAGVEITWASPEAVSAMSETRHPQGVVAVCDQVGDGDLDAVMAGDGPVVVLDAVTDPAPRSDVVYASLRAEGLLRSFSHAQLLEVLEKLRASGAAHAFVTIHSENSFREARLLQALAEGRV